MRTYFIFALSVIFALVVFIMQIKVYYFIKYLYVICILIFGSYSVFKKLKSAVCYAGDDPQDLAVFKNNFKKYKDQETNIFFSKLESRIKYRIEKDRHNDYRHMWE